MNFDAIRFIAFGTIAVVMTVLETLWPARPLIGKTFTRWFHHGSLLLVGTVLIRIIMPLGALGVATLATQKNWGLLPLLEWSPWIKITLAVFVLDLAIYVQHVFFHKHPWMWRLHRVHHTDTHLDTSSGIRFHPLEFGLSLLYKGIVIVLLGASVEAVFIFEVLLNAFSLWSHANIRITPMLDQGLRALLVTPNMHRIHHSVDPKETHRNFGFCLSIWDRIFQTYRQKFASANPELGLADHRSIKDQRVQNLLKQPWDRYFFKR